jgi:amidase
MSAIEVVEAQLGRIENFNPALNAIVTLDAGNARSRARQADRALAAGKSWGLLHGVPITVKDSFDTAGLRSTSGYRPFRDRVPVEDATPVARLREAGAIILGKTNLPALVNGLQTDNALFGRTNNPWDLRRTPGGSSGGAAAAISAGLSFLELGSDIGGSIRIPAHFCGVYGLKATAGRIAAKGHVHVARARRLPAPPDCEALFELASFGPIARSIEDLELVLPIVSEPATPPLTPSAQRALSQLRVAWTDDFGGAPLDGGSRRLIQSFVEALTRSGCHIERRNDVLDYGEAWRISGICSAAVNTLFQSLPVRLARRAVAPLLRQFGPQHPFMQGLFAGLALDRACLRRALEQRMRLIQQVEKFLGEWDCWICPAFPTPAFTHRPKRAPIEVDNQSMPQLEANLYTIIFNMTGHPVVTMPIGLSPECLPIGVQVVGSRWREMALLNAARQIASVTGGFQRPPGY